MKNFKDMLKKSMLVALVVLIGSVVLVPTTAFASDSKLYVTTDMEDGEYYSSYHTGNLAVLGTKSDKVVVAPDERIFGEYKFSKRLDLVSPGNTNYRSIRTYVTKSRQVIVYALSASTEDECSVCLANGYGEIIARETIKTSDSYETSKVVFDIPSNGNYYIFSDDGQLYIYGVYFGAITEEEMIAMGKQIEQKDPYYMLVGQYKEGDKENVFGISLLAFAISLVLFTIILIVKRGTKGVKKLVVTEKKRDDDVIYKE